MSVRGQPLPPRMKWFCHHCAPPSCLEIQQAKRAQEKAEKDAAIYHEKKRQWQVEQERRRVANLEKLNSALKKHSELDELQDKSSGIDCEEHKISYLKSKKVSSFGRLKINKIGFCLCLSVFVFLC